MLQQFSFFHNITLSILDNVILMIKAIPVGRYASTHVARILGCSFGFNNRLSAIRLIKNKLCFTFINMYPGVA